MSFSRTQKPVEEHYHATTTWPINLPPPRQVQAVQPAAERMVECSGVTEECAPEPQQRVDIVLYNNYAFIMPFFAIKNEMYVTKENVYTRLL